MYIFLAMSLLASSFFLPSIYGMSEDPSQDSSLDWILHQGLEQAYAAQSRQNLINGAQNCTPLSTTKAYLRTQIEQGTLAACQLDTWIQQGGDINEPFSGNDYGPLTCAAAYGHNHLVEMILLRNAAINIRNGEALYNAASHGHASTLILLLQRGASIYPIYSNQQKSPLNSLLGTILRSGPTYGREYPSSEEVAQTMESLITWLLLQPLDHEQFSPYEIEYWITKLEVDNSMLGAVHHNLALCNQLASVLKNYKEEIMRRMSIHSMQSNL